MPVVISEIMDRDLDAVSDFLHRNLNDAIPPEEWKASLQPPWRSGPQGHGYQLTDDGRLVGVYAAIYSERTIRGRKEKFCNLSAWYVLPEYRFHSLGLLKKLTDRKGCHLTDLSPKPEITKIMKRLKFEFLDTGVTIASNLSWPVWWPGREIIADPDRIRAVLSGGARQAYDDHAGLPLLRHLVVTHGGKACYLVYLRQRRKGIPCVIVLHIGEPDVLAACYGVLARYFLLRERSVFTIYESRFLTKRPSFSMEARSPHRNKLYRSETLGPADIDNLYSELVTLARQWIVERPRKA